MIQLRGKVDFNNEYDKLKQLPIKVQEEIRQCLEVLDKHYGEPSERSTEDGKVICLETKNEVEKLHTEYNLAMNEYINTFQEGSECYLMVFILCGLKNTVLIVGKEEWLKTYLYA